MSCKEWLVEYLANRGSVLTEVVRTDAADAGFKKNELKAARKEIGVKAFHQFDERGSTPNWFWYIEEAVK